MSRICAKGTIQYRDTFAFVYLYIRCPFLGYGGAAGTPDRRYQHDDRGGDDSHCRVYDFYSPEKPSPETVIFV